MSTPFDLQRFVDAQASNYAAALAELQAGRKRSHWMWYVFPQLAGLGHSATAQHYALRSLDEARAYLAHPLLGARLRTCCECLLQQHSSDAHKIFGSPDDLKLRSSMTLFEATDRGELFARVLDKYYRGERDTRTLALLQQKPG
ncbi:DUF1810 domain-containing protein [Microbulbifer sp. SAOS-129_SWC]|uniref:DUF1810 domain-containing protein n=1 Tax=Microbulbifer sp. SAOS-129_SWC TaxID=3145235 RepID=UPI0032179E1B